MDHKTQDNYQCLNKEMSNHIKKYGLGNLAYSITFELDEPLYFKRHQKFDPQIFYTKLTELIRLNGINSLLIRLNPKEYLYKENIKNINEEKVIKQIVKEVYQRFDCDLEIISGHSRGNGLRTYATGTIYRLMFDFMNPSQEQLQSITPKHKVTISNHKSKVNKLDYSHPLERDFLDKYLTIKDIIIKSIINEYQDK